MAIKLGDAYVALGLQDRDLDRGLNSARAKVSGFLKDIATGISQGLGQAIAHGIGNLIRSGIDQLGKATQAADDLNEAIIRNQKVFGDSAADIRAWSQTAATSLGLSEAAALSNASALGNMLTQLGSSREQAAAMSKQMVEAAADLAAFNSVAGGAEPVLDAMNSAFRGEYDALQRYLPAITDAAIKQQALAETGKESEKQLTSFDKALATQTLILQGATGAAGAFADAVERGAAAEEVFAARMEDMRADVGQVGLIIQQEFFQTLNELLESVGLYGENIVEQLVVGLTRGLTAITPFLAQLRGIFVSVLKPGSPPKLLPELNDWGKAAAEEYLKGWTLADGSMLQTLGSTIENMLRSFAGAGDIEETDLVSRVFGSEKALVNAINEWRTAGSISVGTLDAIRRSAGPAGERVGELVNAFFNLQDATKGVSEAQAQLDAVTRRYDATLSPLQKKLDALGEAQSDLNDQERLAELAKIINNRRSSTSDRQQARLEQEQILLRDQIDAIEDERDAAVDSEKVKLDAAEKERKAKQDVFDQQQMLLDQQVSTNRLIEEETTLRQRLADEALAKEEEERRKLEAQMRKEAAELERISDAHLRYRLQLADTEGDLAIMREELAKTTEGSAEYYDILTQIAQLEEKLASERDGGIEKKADEAGDAALENTKYLDDFRIALDAATDALFGGDGKEVQLTPFWAGVADTIDKIKEAALDATPILQGFIDFVMGGGSGTTGANKLYLPSIGGGTGPADDSLFGKIYSMAVTAIVNLTALKDGDWKTVWENFRTSAQAELQEDIESGNTEGQYLWEQMIEIIDFVEALATGDWKKAWELFVPNMVQGFLDGIANTPAFAQLSEFFAKLGAGDVIGAWAVLGQMSPGGAPSRTPPPGSPPPAGTPNGIPEVTPDWLEKLWEDFFELLKPLQPDLPPSRTQPQSYNIPGIEPTPGMAGVAGAGGTTIDSSTHTIIEQITLVFQGPVTQAEAQLAARTLDQELRARGYAPT